MTTPYQPLHITGNSTGLVQDREEFILPADAYPVLENAYVWRERIKRKQAYKLLGRLKRAFTDLSIGNSGASVWTFNLLTFFGSGKSVAGNITNVTQAVLGQVTSPLHNLVNNQQIIIENVVGMIELNNNTYTITVVDPDNFTIGINTTAFTAYSSGGNWFISNESNASIQLGSVTITIGSGGGAIVFTDNGDGTLSSTTPFNSGTINYQTGSVSLTHTAGAGVPTTVTFSYYPSLPVMGLRTREVGNITTENTIAFDTKYAYFFTSGGWVEWITGANEVIWSGSDSQFFWTTSYWNNGMSPPIKLFWVTNFNTSLTDPIRYTDGATWTTYAPQLDNAGPPNRLEQCLILIPYRGYFVAFNTYEGTSLSGSTNYPQRVRWSVNSGLIAPTDQVHAWNLANAPTFPTGAGYLDIPTGESITAVGFVRDNLVVYCERSTWQLRFRNLSSGPPFQIEKINSELGTSSTFSAVQFDLALVGIGDKGIVNCDGFKSELIDIKIPDLVFNMQNNNEGVYRIYGIRDFRRRLAYWLYPDISREGRDITYPNRRLVYNYENDSWAIFTDSLTCLGDFQPVNGNTWLNVHKAWQACNFPWTFGRASVLQIVGGNQQGYTELLDTFTTNDQSLFIENIQGFLGVTNEPTVITSPNHNLATGDCISILNIPVGTPYAQNLNNPYSGQITGATNADPCVITSNGYNLRTGTEIQIDFVGGMDELNGNVYTIVVVGLNNFSLVDLNGVPVDSTNFGVYTSGGTWRTFTPNTFFVVIGDNSFADVNNKFQLWKLDPISGDPTDPQLDLPGTYVGGGEIQVRDSFFIQSKKFNFIEEGKNIQLGYIDVLMDESINVDPGAISLQIYLNYNDPTAGNAANIPETSPGDPFFNTIVPTGQETPEGISNGVQGSKYWHRAYCAARANFITVVWTFTNAQLAGEEQEKDVQIDAQVLWQRRAGRMTNF